MTPQRSIDSVEALYRKLLRTFERRSTYGEDQVDWVFDTAVTAWHLADWFAKEAGIAVGTTQERLKQSCPELAVCEQVCNGAKHFTLENPKLMPFDFARDVRGTDDRKGISKNVRAGDTGVDIVLTPVVSITDRDGQSWEAIDLFRRVIIFWQRELGLSD